MIFLKTRSFTAFWKDDVKLLSLKVEFQKQSCTLVYINAENLGV